MIFFTLGTEKYPFWRLVEAAERLAQLRPEERIFVQIGNHPQPPRGCDWVRFLAFEEFDRCIERARVVVSHAGAGTILTCAMRGRVPLVLKRERARGEHVDSHQSQLARRMSELGRIVLAESTEELIAAILRRDASPDVSESVAEVPELAQSLADFFGTFEA